MGVFRTSQGRPVKHCHLGQTPECKSTELSQAEIDRFRDAVRRNHPDAVEIRQPTNKYNCVGYALAQSHGWFNMPKYFFRDDYFEASFDSPAKGDVVIYNRLGAFMHIAVVSRVSNGQITRVRSKWGNWAELSHSLDDVDPLYGRPVDLLRPNSGVVSFTDLIDDEEMPEPTGIAPSVALRGDEEMPEYESTEEAIQGALDRLSDPDVYIRVGLASTPEAARVIIESLPGVKELIEIGPEAAPAVLHFLEKAEEQEEAELSGIALYLLQRIPVEESKKPLADSLTEGKFTGINLHLAADALLTSAEVETINDDPITAALNTAEKIKLQE